MKTETVKLETETVTELRCSTHLRTEDGPDGKRKRKKAKSMVCPAKPQRCEVARSIACSVLTFQLAARRKPCASSPMPVRGQAPATPRDQADLGACMQLEATLAKACSATCLATTRASPVTRIALALSPTTSAKNTATAPRIVRSATTRPLWCLLLTCLLVCLFACLLAF